MPLQAFLSHAAGSGRARGEYGGDAGCDDAALGQKGWSFRRCLLSAWKGMFPSQMSLDEGGRLEEASSGLRRRCRAVETDANLYRNSPSGL